MIIEAFVVKEHMQDDSKKVARTSVIILSIWLFFWILTMYYAIVGARKNTKNAGVGLLVSIISWPFYWVFKFTKAIG